MKAVTLLLVGFIVGAALGGFVCYRIGTFQASAASYAAGYLDGGNAWKPKK